MFFLVWTSLCVNIVQGWFSLATEPVSESQSEAYSVTDDLVNIKQRSRKQSFPIALTILSLTIK